MKLTRLETHNGIKLVGVDASDSTVRYVDLAAIDSSLPGCIPGLLKAEDGLDRVRGAFQKGLAAQAFVEGRVLAPIGKPDKVICIGLNYRDHAEETGAEIPSEPVCFNKFPQTVIGPDEAIVLPKVSKKVDYEGELVIVVGKTAKHVTEADARASIAGYMVGHDVSARDWQKGRPGGQWLLGKTPDTFAPTGPWFVTADEVPDPELLDVKLWLNGQLMQSGNTREFIFGVDRLIAHLSQLVTLVPGDLIFTGTPPGVGDARKPPVYLQPGDSVEIEITGLGRLRNPVRGE